MKIELKEICINDLVKGFKDNDEDGVIGFDGKLDIRPPYQREFIYKDKQRDAVIDTIINNYPLNVMYWAVRDDGGFEIIDGQQRTISICQYVISKFSIDGRYFHNLHDDEQNQILNYKLMVYLCSGEPSERLNWFKTINIAGERLTDQEMRNAVFAGPWVTDAKKYFSKTGCVAYQIGSDYINGSAIRQEYLETAIDWLTDGKIVDYMGIHQHDPNASLLWIYFQKVITWVNSNFIKKRACMKGVNWGQLHNTYMEKIYDAKIIEAEVEKLILDDDVQSKSGIYAYILTRDEKHLNIRTFTPSMRQKVYEKQNGICLDCKKNFKLSEMEADHIIPWCDGGKTIEDNCQMLCKVDNRKKSGK